MKVIWKFPIAELAPRVSFPMPAGSKPLDVQVQGGVPTIWVELDPQAERTVRDFRIEATGQPFDHAGAYLATFQIEGGRFVFHVYDLGEHQVLSGGRMAAAGGEHA
jgi:hypothetical protein